MTDIRSSQLPSVSVVSSATNSIRVNQLGMVAVTGETPPPSPMHVNQLAIGTVSGQPSQLQAFQMAIVMVISPNIRCISPDHAIQLECWQPCLSYGTNALVYWRQ